MSESSGVYAESTETGESGVLAAEEGLTSERIAEGDIQSFIVVAEDWKVVLGIFGDWDVARDIKRTMSGRMCFPSDWV